MRNKYKVNTYELEKRITAMVRVALLTALTMASGRAVADEGQHEGQHEDEVVIDQSFTSPFDLGADINECCRCVGQTFTAGLTGELVAVSVSVQSFTSPFHLHVAIREVNFPFVGSVLGEVTLDTSSPPISRIITLPEPIEICAGIIYAIVVDYPEAPPPGPGMGQGNWTGAVGDLYPGGQLFLSRPGEPTCSFDPLSGPPAADVHFITYVSVDDDNGNHNRCNHNRRR